MGENRIGMIEFISGLSVGLFLLVGVWVIFSASENAMRHKAINAGCAYYHQTTGILTWKPKREDDR